MLGDINSRAFFEEILPSGEGECADLGTGFGLIDQTMAKDRSHDLHSMGFDGFSILTFKPATDALRFILAVMALALKLGNFCIKTAAIPETCGAAIEVPL